MRDLPDLHLTLRRSRLRVAFVVLSGTATMVLVLLLPLSWWVRTWVVGVCVIAATVELLAALRADRWRITLCMNRRITVEHDGRERSGTVLDSTYVTRDLTCIVWLEDGARLARAIPVPRDAMGSEDHRRLRVMLRYSRPEVDSSAGFTAGAGTWIKGDLAT